MERVVCWFSCGAASAVAAKKAIEKYGGLKPIDVVYCDTSKNEDADNPRFMADVEKWLGVKITVIRSEKYTYVEEVFADRRYMSGIMGAPCTVEMKKIPRFNYQMADDINVFGFTADGKERKRIRNFKQNNPDLRLDFVLDGAGITKTKCYGILIQAGIELPRLYREGFKNNNCLGCVKATSPAYWNKVRSYAPEVFKRRAEQSRELGVRLTRLKGKRIFLDELPEGDFGRYKPEDISCGPECGPSR